MLRFDRLTLPVLAAIAGFTFSTLHCMAQTPCCDQDAIACDSGCDSACCDRMSGRAFLFAWPGQPLSDLRLNLSEPLITDRPDFTEASSTVGLGVTQLELGYTFTTDNEGAGRTDSHSYPELLVRHGLFRDWLELRVGYNAASENALGIHASGSEDLYLGAKIGLTAQCGWLPEMALIPQMTVPSGSSEFTNDEVLPGLNWLYGWDLTESLSFAGSTQFNRAVDEGSSNEYTQWAQSLTIGTSLTDTVGAYGEWFAFFPEEADTDPVEHYLNGGVTKQFGINVQWDIRAGLGLNDASDDFFVGTGLSMRFL